MFVGVVAPRHRAGMGRRYLSAKLGLNHELTFQNNQPSQVLVRLNLKNRTLPPGSHQGIL